MEDGNNIQVIIQDTGGGEWGKQGDGIIDHGGTWEESSGLVLFASG
jgi:hypothetical protein